MDPQDHAAPACHKNKPEGYKHQNSARNSQDPVSNSDLDFMYQPLRWRRWRRIQQLLQLRIIEFLVFFDNKTYGFMSHCFTMLFPPDARDYNRRKKNPKCRCANIHSISPFNLFRPIKMQVIPKQMQRRLYLVKNEPCCLRTELPSEFSFIPRSF